MGPRRIAAARATLAPVLMLLLAAHAAADVIHYKDGRTLEGRIIERTATELVVETDFGTVRVALSKVDRVEARTTAAEELATRRAEIAAGDATGLFGLAVWARDHELRKEERALLLEVIAADADHELANRALGRRRLDGRWFEPEDLDAYVRAMAPEKLRQGLMFDDGDWRPEDEVMKRRGFLRWHDEWLPRREAETAAAVEDLSSLVGVQATATSGEYVTLFSSLRPDEASALISPLDGIVRDLLERLQPEPAEQQAMLRYDVPVFLLPDEDAVSRFMHSGFVVRFSPVEGFEDRFDQSGGFSLHWPRPLVGLRLTRPDGTGRDELQRLGVLSHQLAHVMVQRFKALYPCPAWIEAGFAAFYEGLVTGHGSLTVSSFLRDEGGDAVDPFVAGWGDAAEWQMQLTDPAVVAALPSLASVMALPIQRLDSRDAAMSWSLLRYLLPEHDREVAAYLRRYGREASERGRPASELHAAAWKEAFAQPIEEVDAAWRAWALSQPRVLEPERLSR